MAVDETPHDPSRMFGRPYADAFLIDTRTGERKAVAERLAHLIGPSPGGRYVLSFRDGHYYAYDVETGKTACLTAEPEGLVRQRRGRPPDARAVALTRSRSGPGETRLSCSTTATTSGRSVPTAPRRPG